MIDLSIPGQMTEGELRAIEEIAAQAKHDSSIVEVGSLFGLSSYVWATSAPAGSTVFCIDPWVREKWIAEFENTVPRCPAFSRAEFERFTKGCRNIVALQGYSPRDFRDWDRPVDILFDDSVHSNPQFRRNLKFWLRFMKPGGIMCGHDYGNEFPDVRSEVHKLARDLRTEVHTKERVWWVAVPQDFDARTRRLRSLFPGRYC